MLQPALPYSAQHNSQTFSSQRLMEGLASAPSLLASWLDRNTRLFILAFSLAYLSGTSFVASHRFLWADEVLTAYLTRLTLPNLLTALASGLDIQPPLFHL